MRIRHPLLLKMAGLFGSWLIRIWMRTIRYESAHHGENLLPDRPHLPGRYIYAFWHENLLTLAYQYARHGIAVLISRHADGQLIAEICGRLGYVAVRGSTTRGGVEALRGMLRASGVGHLAVTPDGPRGPRGQVQPGLVFLAAHTGLPIVPVSVSYSRCWRVRSWDRFVVPKPFSRAIYMVGGAIHVPPNLDREALEAYRQTVERELRALTEGAEGRRASCASRGSLGRRGKRDKRVA